MLRVMNHKNNHTNLRSSNTEPVVRFNVEAKGNECLMREKTREILKCLHNSTSEI